MCGKSFAQRAGVSVHKRKNCKNRNRHLLTVEAPDFDIIYTIEVPVMPVQQQEVTTSNVQVTTSQDIEKMINDTKKFAEEDADTMDTKEPKVEPGDKVEQQQQKEDQSIIDNFEDLFDQVLTENGYYT